MESVTLLYKPIFLILEKPKSLIFLVGFRWELAQSTYCDAADPVVAAASDEGAVSETPFSTLTFFIPYMDMYLVYWISGRLGKLRIYYILIIEFELFVDLALFFNDCFIEYLICSYVRGFGVLGLQYGHSKYRRS